MGTANLAAILSSELPLYVQIPGHPPLRLDTIAVEYLEVVGDDVLGWCRDATHPFAVQVVALKVEGQTADGLEIDPPLLDARLERGAFSGNAEPPP